MAITWITGSSTGIGRHLALSLAGRGNLVAVSARNKSRLSSLESAFPNHIRSFPLDVGNPEEVAACVRQIEQWGPIERAFLNAGDYRPMPLDEFDVGLFERLVRVNYLGVVYGLDALIPLMRQRAAGEILITASLAGYRGLPASAPYSASKAALITLAESLEPELADIGVRLRLINPGFVQTPLTSKNQFQMPFLISPESAARSILEQLEGRAFEISFPRRMKWVMQCLKLLPDRLFLKLTRRMVH